MNDRPELLTYKLNTRPETDMFWTVCPHALNTLSLSGILSLAEMGELANVWMALVDQLLQDENPLHCCPAKAG